MRRPEELKVHKNRLPYPFCLDMKALRNWINDGSHDETELPQLFLPISWFSSTDRRILGKAPAPPESSLSELAFVLIRTRQKKSDAYTHFRLKSMGNPAAHIPPGYPALLLRSSSTTTAQNPDSEVLNLVSIDARALARRLRFLTILLIPTLTGMILTQIVFQRTIVMICFGWATLIIARLAVGALMLFDVLYGLLCSHSNQI